MGKSFAGDHGRLTPPRGHWAALIFNIARSLIGLSAFGEIRHAC